MCLAQMSRRPPTASPQAYCRLATPATHVFGSIQWGVLGPWELWVWVHGWGPSPSNRPHPQPTPMGTPMGTLMGTRMAHSWAHPWAHSWPTHGHTHGHTHWRTHVHTHGTVIYIHLRAPETLLYLVCRLMLEIRNCLFYPSPIPRN